MGSRRVRLVDSGVVFALLRDGEGRVWGPYSYEYRLVQRPKDGGCLLQEPGRLFYRAGEQVSLTLSYSMPTALAAVEVWTDGALVTSFTSSSAPMGLTSVTVPPLGSEGAHTISCHITSPGLDAREGNSIVLSVDATPPSGQWAHAAQFAPPTHFRVQAGDLGGSGVAGAELCDTSGSYCLPMEPAGGAAFVFSTAFWIPQRPAFGTKAFVYDGAGNRAELAPVTIVPSDYPSYSPPYSHAITVTPKSTLNLAALLLAEGLGAPDEVRTSDFTPVSPEAVPLNHGWNEVLFRWPGNATWELYSVYRAGIRVELPAKTGAHHWLVYATGSSVPALQASLIGTVPVTTAAWERLWFDIPRLFFVEDQNDNKKWDDAEPLYLPAAWPPAGPWLARGQAVNTELVQAITSPTTVTQATKVTCAGCIAGKTLVLQRRTSAHGAPVGKKTWGSLGFLSEELFLASFPGEAAEVCLFFWDEDGNGAPSGNDPRDTGSCNQSEFSLVRELPLSAAVEGESVVVSGVPFGQTVTLIAEVPDVSGNGIFLAGLERRVETEGTGTLRISREELASWPLRVTIGTPERYTSVELGGHLIAANETVEVEVRDELGNLHAAALESNLTARTDYRVYDPQAGAYTAVPRQEGYRVRVRARKDGFLSKWVYADYDGATVPLFTPDSAGRIEGVVRDSSGNPAPFSLVSWEADPYSAQTYSDESGSFSLLALGAGALSVSNPLNGSRLARPLTVAVGQVVREDLVLPGLVDDQWPKGMRSPYPNKITGSAPVTMVSDARYTWGAFPAGTWYVRADGELMRTFSLPGALPVLQWWQPAWHTVAWSGTLLETTAWMRCGEKFQPVVFGSYPLVDSLCWEWYAKWGNATYFLGRPHPEGGMPPAGLQTVEVSVLLNGSPASGKQIRFVDRIFNRAITATTGPDGALRTTLPQGYYEVQQGDGRQLLDGAGAPGHLRVSPNLDSGGSFRYP